MCKKEGCETPPTPGYLFCQICHDTYGIIKNLRHEMATLKRENQRLRSERNRAEGHVQVLKKKLRAQERESFRFSPPIYDQPVFAAPRPLKRQNATADLSNLIHTLNTVYKRQRQ